MKEKVKLKNIKVSEETHSEFTKIQGQLVSVSGEKVTQDETMKTILKERRKNKG